MVDAGTVELVRSLGVEVVSSAELIQAFEARWTPEALESHLEAGRRVDRVRAEAFALIRERTRNGAPLQELDVKRFVREGFAKAGMVTDHGPIVGVNANASNPHYEPTEEVTAPIRARRLGAAGYVGQARPPRRGLLRHHLDRLLRRPPHGRDAQGVRHGDRRARRRHRARSERHRRRLPAVRLGGGRRRARRDRERRVRDVLHAPHGPFHRPGSARKRRQHGQSRDPRRAPRRARGPASPSSRASTWRSSACAPRSTCSWASARRGSRARSSARWRCSDAGASAGRGGDTAGLRPARQPDRTAIGPRQRRAGVGDAQHFPLPPRAGGASARGEGGGAGAGAKWRSTTRPARCACGRNSSTSPFRSTGCCCACAAWMECR